jgi:hypothetical protein
MLRVASSKLPCGHQGSRTPGVILLRETDIPANPWMRSHSWVALALDLLRTVVLDAELLSLTMYRPVVSPEYFLISWIEVVGDAKIGRAKTTAAKTENLMMGCRDES